MVGLVLHAMTRRVGGFVDVLSFPLQKQVYIALLVSFRVRGWEEGRGGRAELLDTLEGGTIAERVNIQHDNQRMQNRPK